MVSFLATHAVTPTALTPSAQTFTTTATNSAPFATQADGFSDGATSVARSFANVCGPITRRPTTLALALSATACTNGEIAAASIGALAGACGILFALSPFFRLAFRITSKLINQDDPSSFVKLRRSSETPWRAHAFGKRQVDLMINTIYRTGDANKAKGLVAILDNLAQTRPGAFNRQSLGGLKTVHGDKPELGLDEVIAKLEGKIE